MARVTDLRKIIRRAIVWQAVRLGKAYYSEKSELKKQDAQGQRNKLDKELKSEFELLVSLTDCLYKINASTPNVRDDDAKENPDGEVSELLDEDKAALDRAEALLKEIKKK